MSTELDQLRRQNHDLHMRLDAVRRDRDRLYEEVLDLSATVAMLRRKHEGHTGLLLGEVCPCRRCTAEED